MRRLGKVIVYITRDHQLLVFRQPASPSAGVQVPAGTIRADEAPATAALREVVEETGWTWFGEPTLLGRAEFDCTPFGKAELHERWFFHLEIEGDPPAVWSHHERDAEDGAPPIEFAFRFRPLAGAEEELIADQGRLLPVLRARLRVRTPDA
jgi:8-oxo-dGTP diphosphatase